ncbi:MAG: alpha/beta hydrolase [Aureliella sp.]
MPLHPQSAEFVSMLAEQNPPGWEDLTPTAGREAFAGLEGLFGEKVAVEHVDDYAIGESIEAIDPAASGPVNGVKVRAYRPGPGVLPALVFFHGGGFVLGNVETHDALCRRLAVASGRCVISVDYRLSPEAKYPEPLDDCVLATEGVHRFADQFGIDPTRISLAGDSAGGNLAAAVALRLRDAGSVQIESLALLYPVVQPDFETESYRDFATGHGLTQSTMKWFWKQYAGDLSQELPYARLLDANLSGLPPTLVVVAEYDVLRDECHCLAERLVASGVETTTHQFDGMLHGFIHFNGFFETGLNAITDIGEFLSDQ